MSIMDEVAERLVRFRMQAGLEPETAAMRAGIDVERLADAEAGELRLTDAEIETLASAYGIDPTQVFGGQITPMRNIAGA
jgi:transcriptional regulator with XRE-family HTH domain